MDYLTVEQSIWWLASVIRTYRETPGSRPKGEWICGNMRLTDINGTSMIGRVPREISSLFPLEGNCSRLDIAVVANDCVVVEQITIQSSIDGAKSRMDDKHVLLQLHALMSHLVLTDPVHIFKQRCAKQRTWSAPPATATSSPGAAANTASPIKRKLTPQEINIRCVLAGTQHGAKMCHKFDMGKHVLRTEKLTVTVNVNKFWAKMVEEELYPPSSTSLARDAAALSDASPSPPPQRQQQQQQQQQHFTNNSSLVGGEGGGSSFGGTSGGGAPSALAEAIARAGRASAGPQGAGGSSFDGNASVTSGKSWPTPPFQPQSTPPFGATSLTSAGLGEGVSPESFGGAEFALPRAVGSIGAGANSMEKHHLSITEGPALVPITCGSPLASDKKKQQSGGGGGGAPSHFDCYIPFLADDDIAEAGGGGGGGSQSSVPVGRVSISPENADSAGNDDVLEMLHFCETVALSEQEDVFVLECLSTIPPK